jgi:putative endonuclease
MSEAMTGTTRQPWWRRWFGTRGERAAARYLRQSGFRLLRRNYRCRLGEIDVIALEGDTVVFVEVRSTERSDAGRPAASVNSSKQAQVSKLALHFLSTHRLLNQRIRFDVIAVRWPRAEKLPEIHHFRNAFETVGPRHAFH